jgi:hypothetical protein
MSRIDGRHEADIPGVAPVQAQSHRQPDQVTVKASLPELGWSPFAAVPAGLFRDLLDALGYQDWKVVRRHLVSLVVLVAARGHLADLEWLRGDASLERLVGFRLSS